MENSLEFLHDGDDDDGNATISCLQREKWCIKEDVYKLNGFWFPRAYVESTTRVLQHFHPHTKDVILASFPKTGTTWLKALLHSIMNRSNDRSSSLNSVHPHHLVPSLETYIYLQDTTIRSKVPEEGRILGTHLPHQILGHVLASSNCKIVYVTRNPKDTLNSLWHFVQTSPHFEQDPWKLGFAVDQFCEGVVPFGPYYEHVLGYREQSLRRPENVLFVTYEGLKEDPNKHVARMGQFLGCPFDDDDGEVERIVEMCRFGRLSELEVNRCSDASKEFPLPYNAFFRKGEVGDYRSHLADDLVAKIDGVTREKFHGIGFGYGI